MCPGLVLSLAISLPNAIGVVQVEVPQRCARDRANNVIPPHGSEAKVLSRSGY